MDIAIDRKHRATELAQLPDPVAVNVRYRYTWPLFAAQLCMYALFIGMSLVAIAVNSWLSGDGTQRTSAHLGLMLAGVTLTLLAWRGGARWLAHLDMNDGRPVQTELLLDSRDERPAPPASLLGIAHPRNGTLLASHR
ncbi:MAG: hypothetical protein ABI537_15535 [Casimicrobiaceae bacterium]